MRQVLVLFALVILAAAGFGCSNPAAEEQSSADANSSAVTDFSTITDPNAALEQGKRLLDENQTESAIAALKRAIELNPDLPEAHFQLGIAYALLEMQNQLEGINTTTEAEANTGNSKESNTKEGRAKTRSEKAFERAVEAYKKWLDANPKDDVGYYNLGRAYSKLMKDEEAEKAFEEAVKLKPEDAEYQTELGAIRIKLAKYREAIEPLKKAVELDAENVRAQELLEDAEAGRSRIDYVSPKNTNGNSNSSGSNSNSNSNSVSNSNSNSAPRRPDSNIRTNSVVPPRNPTPNRPANRPN